MTQDHSPTPRPWETYVDEDGIILAIRKWVPTDDGKGHRSHDIAACPRGRTYADWQDDAKLMLAAVNSHDAVCAALQNFLNGVSTGELTSAADETLANAVSQARAALNLARGK